MLTLLVSVALSISTSALVAIVALTWQRAKIRCVGGSSGSTAIGGKQSHSSTLMFENTPTVWGMKVARHPAVIETARIFDVTGTVPVGNPLRWRLADGSLSPRIEIRSGGAEHLLMFGRETDLPGYFVYSPERPGDPPAVAAVRFTEPRREFVLVLTDDLRRDHRFGFVVMSMEHGIQIVLKLSWSARWYRLKKAARVFRSAFVSQ